MNGEREFSTQVKFWNWICKRRDERNW